MIDARDDDAVFDEDGDDDGIDTDAIHLDKPIRESNFKDLLEISDNYVDSKRLLMISIIIK